MLKKMIAWWVFIVTGLFILFLTLFLRLKNLTLLPIFADEAIYIRWAQVMQAESTLRFLPLSDGKPPLFMWSVIPFLKIFSDPLLAGRLVSIVCGVITLAGIFTLCLLLFKSKKIALMAAFIYSIMPFSIFFDRLALVDSMLSMFGLWTFIFMLLTVKNLKFDHALLTGFALGGAYLTKSPALFFTLLLPTTWLVAHWSKNVKKSLALFFKLILLSLVAYLLSQLLYNILRLGPNFHLLKSRNFDYVYPLSQIINNPLDPLVSHLRDVINWFSRLGPSPLIIFFLSGLIIAFKKGYFRETLLLLLWFLVPILAQAEYARVFTARYILYTLPFGVIIASLWLLANSKILKLFFVLVLVGFIFLSLKQDYYFLTNPQKADLPGGERSGYLEEWTSGYGIREVGDYLREEYKKDPDKKIVVGTEGFFGTLPDGLQMYLNDLKEIIVIGAGIGFETIPQSLIASVEAGNKTYLVVNNTRFKTANPLREGLVLINSYPKAFRRERTREFVVSGPQESLLFFKLVASRS